MQKKLEYVCLAALNKLVTIKGKLSGLSKLARIKKNFNSGKSLAFLTKAIIFCLKFFEFQEYFSSFFMEKR